MAFTFAGQYGPEQLIDALGRPLPNVSVAVYVKGTSTPITLYTDRTKGTVAPNPVASSTLGNLLFWADPGQCDIVANGTRLTVDVPLDPLEPNATFVPAAPVSLDGNAGPYNLVAGSSGAAVANAAALKTLLADAATKAVAAASGLAIVELTPGEYYVGGALITTGGTNTLIPLPVVASTSPNVVISIRPKGSPDGSAAPFITAPKGSLTFHSTFTGGTYDGVNGWPSIFGARTAIHGVPSAGDVNVSWCTIVWNSCRFRQPANPSLCAVDGYYVDRMRFRNCSWDTEDVLNANNHYPTQPTHPTGIANIAPANNLDGFMYEGTNDCVAHYGGFAISELCHNAGLLFPLECVVGLNIQEDFFHAADIGHTLPTRCNYSLGHVDGVNGVAAVPDGPHLPVTLFGIIDVEDANSQTGVTWQNTVRHINDPTSSISGEITVHRVLSGIGMTGAPPIVLGARHLRIRSSQITATSPSPLTVVLDAIGRNDSTNTPGSPEYGGTAWSALVGTWGISNGSFYTSVATAASVMVTDSGNANCTVCGRLVINNGMALVVRCQDGTNMLIVDLGSKGDVYTVVAGVLTKVLTGTVTINQGDYIAVKMNGTTITVLVNEVQSVTGTVANFSTQTKHGFWVSSSILGRVRDFLVTAP